ncbi:hypothetical protein FDP41_000501 [Naegleria fowleri]|uniref:Prostaglandin E synthase 2 n=1 Tax=Naegleria fowleri TaxID=5763 RepID=A0A6A5CC13_NAEFO|nr:uncharacterized protein FDP41_000501 [Naegleria fowleri]KAF0984602.1 hypothetical protein FDP41_000501 [Naegleria fowleri]CAG4707864.1 unnamed protein product [Naegleria fowleri]
MSLLNRSIVFLSSKACANRYTNVAGFARLNRWSSSVVMAMQKNVSSSSNFGVFMSNNNKREFSSNQHQRFLPPPTTPQEEKPSDNPKQGNTTIKALVVILAGAASILVASSMLADDVKAEEQATAEIGNPQSTVREEESKNRYEIEDGINILREILKGKDKSQFSITLYQYQVCPFCCKVRAFLDYNEIPYKIVEVNPLFKSEIKFSKDYKKVPIVVVEGLLNNQLNDSSRIITHLNDVIDTSGKMNTTDVVKWRKWVDDTFVHTLAPNIYRSNEEAVEAFEYISEQNGFGWWQKQAVLYGGSFTMYAVAKRLKKKYGIDNEREAIYACGRKWANEALDPSKGPFHGGNEPDLADLAVYGILSSIEGLRTFNDLSKEVPQIGVWYHTMKNVVNYHKQNKQNKVN